MSFRELDPWHQGCEISDIESPVKMAQTENPGPLPAAGGWSLWWTVQYENLL